MRLTSIVFLTILLLTSPAWPISQISGLAVDPNPRAPTSCSGSFTYTVQESFTVPMGGVARAIAAHTGGSNYGAYIFQAGGATFLDYFTIIPFARSNNQIQLSASGGIIPSPISSIFLDVDETSGKVFVTWAVPQATCGSPSSGCLGAMRIGGTNIEGTNSAVVNRINGVFGLTMDTLSLYVRAEGTGVLSQDTNPSLHKILKSALSSTAVIRLATTTTQRGLPGHPAYDPSTDMLYTGNGANTGEAYRIRASDFSLLTTQTQGLTSDTLAGVTFARTSGPTDRVYFGTTTGFTLRLDATTLVSQTSHSLGLAMGGQAMIPDPINSTLHVQLNDGASATSLQRVPIPVMSNANNIGGSFNVDVVGYSMPLKRILETDRATQTTLRSVRFC